jgi:hypothetical protein
MDWLIDLAEVSVTYACPDIRVREQLWGRILAAMGGLASRLSEPQRVVLQDLSNLLGTPGAWDAIAQSVPAAPAAISPLPKGYSVAVYTLTESVGQRVADSLEHLHPSVRVDLLHSNVADTRLIEVARRADLMVVCWRSAKHAATGAIKQARPPTLPTLYATGKGSSSILAEIEMHLAAIGKQPAAQIARANSEPTWDFGGSQAL